jgi:hypothetical protein
MLDRVPGVTDASFAVAAGGIGFDSVELRCR